MPIFQPGGTNTGYRAPAKTLTIKALQDRQKMMAESSASAAAAAPPVANMWQGFGALANQLGDSVNMNRAASQEADARAQLSQIMAGIDPNQGASMEQIAQMQQLDPEFANKEYERAMKQRFDIANREDQQAAATDLQTGQQTFTAGQNTLSRDATAEQNELGRDATAEQNDLNRQADIAKQKMQEAAADGRQEDQQVAAQELAELTAKLDATKATQAAEIKVEAIGSESDARIEQAKKLGLKEGTPEWEHYTATGDIPTPAASTNIYNTGQQPEFDKESDKLAAARLGTVVQEGMDAKSQLANLRIVADLGKQIGTGKEEELVQLLGPYAQAAGLDRDMFSGLGAGQAYSAIIDKMAPNMRVAGSGPTSDFDAKQFLSSLPSIGRTPEGNAVINATFEALGQNKMMAAEIAAKAQSKQISWTDAEQQIRALPDPYAEFKKIMGNTTAPDATDTGAGGGPVFDPAVDEEGDTGTDDAGVKWIVQGGKWVKAAE